MNYTLRFPIVLIAKIFVLIVFLQYNNGASPTTELNQLNNSMLALWMDELAYCIITNPSMQYPQAVEYCWHKWPNRRGFYSLPTEGTSAESFDGHCCTTEMPLIDRGFNQGL